MSVPENGLFLTLLREKYGEIPDTVNRNGEIVC